MTHTQTNPVRSPPTAAVVYWQGLDRLPRDGGGHRVLAWADALEAMGYRTAVVGLQSADATSGAKGGVLGPVKRALLPLPLRRRLPVLDADVVVATVPATFPDAVRSVDPDRTALVLDWMDRWSAIAGTWARHHPRVLTRCGARVQAAAWRRAEYRTMAAAPAQVFAAYQDLEGAADSGATNARWLPTPCEAGPRRAGVRPLCRVGFIGNFGYAPNRDAIGWFTGAWSEQLRRDGVDLLVAGYGSAELPLPPEVERLGAVDDLEAFYDAVDAVVVPVRVGGGIKVKAVEAMVRGIPVLGTDHVREGLPPSLRPFVHGLDSLRRGRTPAVPDAAALSVFSRASFRDTVRATLAERGREAVPESAC